jgi:hypothetical protein
MMRLDVSLIFQNLTGILEVADFFMMPRVLYISFNRHTPKVYGIAVSGQHQCRAAFQTFRSSGIITETGVAAWVNDYTRLEIINAVVPC